MWGSGADLTTRCGGCERQQRRTKRGRNVGHLRRRTNERTSDWEHLVTLIDGNVGDPATDTSDDARGGATACGRARGARRAHAHRHVQDTARQRPGRRQRGAGVGRHAGAQAQRSARAGRRQQDRQRHRPCVGGSARCRPDARRHPHHLGARRRRQHTGARRPVDPHGRRPHRRGAQLLQAGVAPARHGHRQGSAQPEHPVVLRVDQGRPRGGARRRQRARLRRGQRPVAQRRDQLRPRPLLRVLRSAHRVRPLPPAPPPAARGDRDAAVLLPARRVRPRGRTRRHRRHRRGGRSSTT